MLHQNEDRLHDIANTAVSKTANSIIPDNDSKYILFYYECVSPLKIEVLNQIQTLVWAKIMKKYFHDMKPSQNVRKKSSFYAKSCSFSEKVTIGTKFPGANMNFSRFPRP